VRASEEVVEVDEGMGPRTGKLEYLKCSPTDYLGKQVGTKC